MSGGKGYRLPVHLSPGTYALFATYSPDGTALAFRRSNFDGTDFTEMTEGTPWLADPDMSHRRSVGSPRGWASQVDPEALWPAWSPDGRYLAYESLLCRPVFVVDVATGHARRIVLGENPSWLDNHTLIVEPSRCRR